MTRVIRRAHRFPSFRYTARVHVPVGWRLRGHRPVSGRDHAVRVLVREVPEDDARLFPGGPVVALVGDLLHDRRHRNEHVVVHRRAGAGLRRQHGVPATGARLHHRPRHRQRSSSSRRIFAASWSRRTSCCSGGSVRREDGRVRHLPDHAVARRWHPPVRDRAGHRGGDRRAGDVDGDRSWRAR